MVGQTNALQALMHQFGNAYGAGNKGAPAFDALPAGNAYGLTKANPGRAYGRQKAAGAPDGVLSPDMMKQQAANTPGGPQRGGGLGDLLSGAGLDSVELSPDANYSLQYARTQFEVNFKAMESIRTANGVTTRTLDFSFKASFESLSVMAGGQPIDPFAPAENGQPADPMARMMEFFSPEKTAGRILDFALSFFPMSSHFEEGGDTEESRQAFADHMGEAVQKGFDEALNILDGMESFTQEIRDDVDKTHEIVFDGFEDFVKNGLDPEKAGGSGVYARIQAYQMEMSLEMTHREARSAFVAEDAPADPQTPRAPYQVGVDA